MIAYSMVGCAGNNICINLNEKKIISKEGDIVEYSDKSTPRVPDESTPDLVTNNPSYFTTGLY